MSQFFTPFLIALPLALAACGTIDTSVSRSTSAAPSEEFTSYTPVYAGGGETTESQLMNDGISGFVTNPDGSISQILVRLSEDGETAYVSIDGGEETAWTNKTDGDENGGTWTNGDQTLIVDWSGIKFGNSSLDDMPAVFGLETPTDSLPGGNVSYRGSFHTDGDIAQANGTMTMDIDFASGDIGGSINGGYSGHGRMSGTIDGALDGSRMAGSITMTSEGISGSLDFMGGVYGEDGDTAAGVLAGDITAGGITDTQTGLFILNQSGR